MHGTVTFYHDFRKAPPGRRVLKLCRAESCQAAGGDALAERAEAKLGVGMGETTPDGRVTLEAVYCLGLCHSSPAAMLDSHVHAMLDDQKLEALLKEAQA
jgi:formate dehydrogenase subunit gamma